MNNYAKLIESHMISFKESMVLNYKKIGLNEIEAMVIILLYENKKHKSGAISVKTILPYVTMSESELSKIVVSLVERGYIELSIIDNKESFQLTPTMQKLGGVIEVEHRTTDDVKTQSREIIHYLETNYQRTLSASELLIIQRWFDENRTLQDMMKVIDESLALKKYNLKYADAIMTKNSNNKEEVQVDPEMLELLGKVNVRR